MRKLALPSTAILGAMLALSLPAAPAQALPRTWVASNGINNAFCDRTTPCLTFDFAHVATDAGGEIHCVDAGNYGLVTITKAISIVCDNTQAGIQIFSNQVAITISAGANDIVTLVGLDLAGRGTAQAGIVFISGAALHVHKVKIRNFRKAADNAGGIFFQPDTYAELYVTDSIITDNGGPGPLSGGIIITPGASGSVNASINRVRLENNSKGIIVDGTRSTGVAVNATILDTVVAGSAGNGFEAKSATGNAAASILVDHSVASGNFASGIIANGNGTLVRIGDSTIVLNVTGVSASGGGVVQSFKNNRISGNSTDGTPIPAFPGPGGTPLQ